MRDKTFIAISLVVLGLMIIGGCWLSISIFAAGQGSEMTIGPAHFASTSPTLTEVGF